MNKGRRFVHALEIAPRDAPRKPLYLAHRQPALLQFGQRAIALPPLGSAFTPPKLGAFALRHRRKARHVGADAPSFNLSSGK